MRIRMAITWGMLLVVAAGIVAAPSIALAAGGSISIGPSKMAMSLLKGGSYVETLRIENDSDFPMKIAVEPWNFAYDEDGKIHRISDKDAVRLRGAAKWVEALEPITIPPHVEATLPVSVTVPKDAVVGTHSAYLRVTGVPVVKQDNQESLAKVRYQLHGLLLVIVQSPTKSETLKAAAKLVSFATPEKFALDDPVPFAAEFNNTGNVHLDLNGKIVIKDARGKLVTVLPVKDHTLLPESTTRLDRPWKNPPLFGKFSAQLLGDCSIADLNQTFKSPSVEFWYVSRPFLYWTSAGAILFLALYVALRRRFKFKLVRVEAEPK